ncbi:MAG TPA: hypothetical protein VE781_02650, partial [Kineosporiaceae bacterium]|nr:hypothetical protein [Kineosporiaceae bacterium]
MSGSEVRTGTQRRRSVVVLAAAGSAAALLVAAGVTVVARHSSTPSTQSSTRAGSVPAASTHGTLPAGPVPTVAAVDLTGAVPWIATAPTEAPAVPSATPSPQAARPCTVRDVAVTVAPDVRVTGHRLSSVRFHNVGATACLLSGSPRVVASEPGHPDVVGTPGTFVDSDEAGPMRPGDDTDLVVETTTSCPRRPGGGPPGPGYHHVAVTLSGGGTVTATDRDEALDVTCGLGVGHFFLQQADVPEPPDPLAPLHVTLELPPSVAAGDPLVYVVALTNPTQQPVSLDP